MYHPTRGGVRGGRDQFKWDDVKVDKHRENYLGHSVKAPVGRWQKGKDLFWYSRDKNAQGSDQDALKAEIQRVKEEEEQMMREALGLAPKRSNRPQGNRIDRHEFSELVKRGSTAEDLGKGHADAAQVNGLGFARAPKNWEETNSLQPSENVVSEEPADTVTNHPSTEMMKREDREEDENSRRKRRREERKREKQERREKRHSRDADEKRHSRDADERRHSSDLDEKRSHKKERRRHDSDSD